jgi:Concanavalin A-like lectin/glucanases superfamily/Secretion system C-terminal sorting domain
VKKHFKSLIVFLLLTTISFAQIPSYVPSNGLVGWWPFNGNANDESGNGNNGTVNGATLTADRFGVIEKAYDFNGSSYIEVPNWDEILGASDFTITLWINPSTYNGWILAFGLNQDGQGFSCGNWHWGGENLGAQIWKYNYISPNQAILPTSTWNFLTIKFSQNTIVTFLNGVQQNSQLVNYVQTNLSAGILNFAKQIGFNEFFKGSLDDIGIWNRALTEAEIALLYAGCDLSVLSQPQDQSVATSVGTASFSTNVSSSSATYQWQSNLGLGFQNLSNAGQYSGTTTETLTVSGLSLSNNNQVFRCVINDSGCADTTAEAVLTIIDDASIQSHTNTSLQLYPNPVKDVMTLVGLKGDAVSFAVYSVDGKLIKSGQTSGEIQLEDLEKGNYILKIENEALPFVKL